MELPGDMGAFVRVVERRSFSAAAQDLGLTPSAVSKLVTRLEERLRVRLLHRTTRRLSLTSEGEHYFVRARKILADIADAEAEIARSQAEPAADCASTPASRSQPTSSRRRCQSSLHAIQTLPSNYRLRIVLSTLWRIMPMSRSAPAGYPRRL